MPRCSRIAATSRRTFSTSLRAVIPLHQVWILIVAARRSLYRLTAMRRRMFFWTMVTSELSLFERRDSSAASMPARKKIFVRPGWYLSGSLIVFSRMRAQRGFSSRFLIMGSHSEE